MLATITAARSLSGLTRKIARPSRSRLKERFATLRCRGPRPRTQFSISCGAQIRDQKSKQSIEFRLGARNVSPAPMTSPRQRSIEVRVPASTANLGAGFDCLGLALEMYLTARATVQIRPGSRTLARTRGVGRSASLPKSPEENLIFRAMRYAAEKEGFQLPAVRLAVKNEIPLAGGLGSSAAAAVAGIALAYATAGCSLSRENTLRYANEIEGHADNAGAALHGGLVVTYSTAG